MRPAVIKRKLYLLLAKYFLFWAGFAYKRWQPQTIVITGSVGKTTMLNLLEFQVGSQRAHYSHRANSIYGIAFDVLGLQGITGSRWRWLLNFLLAPIKAFSVKRSQEYYFAEVDADRPQEAARLAAWLKPKIVIWLSSDHSHAANYYRQWPNLGRDQIVNKIAAEYAAVANQASQLVLYNSSSPTVKQQIKKLGTSAKLIGASQADLKSYKPGFKKTVFELASGQQFSFNCPMPKQTGLQLEIMSKLLDNLQIPARVGLQQIDFPPGRSSALKGIKNSQIIDSSYNAHLSSMKAMIDMFNQIKHANKWLILGDMIEQGKDEQTEHQQLARFIAKHKYSQVVLIGRRMQAYAEPELSDSEFKLKTFAKPKPALDFIKRNLTQDSLMLFKGSQYLEGIIKELLANPADSKLLCRQEPAATKRRAKFGLK